MYLGVMLVSGEIHALIAMAIIVLLYVRKLRLEERILSRNFGPAWDDFRRHSWALLPPLF
jgi:protein-S-isoprenylcysteine O-methyltransferase Ste14